MESRVPQLTFVSFEDSKARKRAHANVQQDSSRSKPEEPSSTQPNRKPSLPPPISASQLALGGAAVLKDGPSHHGPIVSSSNIPKSAQGSLTLPPLHSRVKGLRPSPLDLNKEISPSDRAITIGIALSPSTVSNYTKSPSPILPRSSPPEPRTIVDEKTGQEVTTPRIIITPAKERFSPSEISRSTGYRPASSVYSRYTTGAPRSAQNGGTPPVPPLPLFVDKKAMHSSRVSSTTMFEEDMPASAPSADVSPLPKSQYTHESKKAARESRPLTAGLPTPRRSKGWWNIITSPFSAKTPTFWRSPSPQEDSQPILADAASMGSDPHAGVIFTNRAPDDTSLRSAPASGVDLGDKEDLIRRIPKRSDTAPGATDPDSSVVNIYRIPSTGEAAAYYNPNRHFPSLCLLSRSLDQDDALAGWSPSQSVFIPSRESRAPEEIGRSAFSPETVFSDVTNRHTAPGAGSRGVPAAASPEAKPNGVAVGTTMFSTPSEEELKSAGLSRAPPQRGFTQATMDSMMSPMSATPIVEDAHVARMMGPHSARGEQRQVEVEAAPTPSQYGLGYATLGAATISHGEETREAKPAGRMLEKPQRPPHIRKDSHGLGISDGERELFPPPQMLSEKPRLGTDKFGQLTIRSDEVKGPEEPWFLRYCWFIAAACASLLILIIVLMVVYIPQRHNDMPVQAAWLNLTGFPALVTGISTIIQPNKTDSRDTCVRPSGMWSCAAPTQDEPGLPNFRLEIRFRNGTVPRNETVPLTSSSNSSKKRWQDTSPPHKFMKRSNNAWNTYLFTPSPSPPSQDDQEFLGRTTDNITATPYNGEETPFSISLLDPIALPAASSTLHKKRSDNSNFTYPYPSDSSDSKASTDPADADAIPSPPIQPLSQTLYPLVTAQPLRLFDRGLDSEHYGFYAYFDRTISIAGLTQNATSSRFASNIPLRNASGICTFSQTRFVVQIWTRRGTLTSLDGDSGGVIALAGNSTANEMEAPGSFPFPVTVSIDRHGGDAGKKGVYCYGVDGEGNVVREERVWVEEDRAVGGELVNPAEVPGGSGTSSSKTDKREDGGIDGGVDGGSGGCGCKWQNWD